MDDICDVSPIAIAPLLATPLPLVMAIKIKTHIKSLEKKLKSFKRKAANQGKRLQKAQKKLSEPEKEVSRLQQEVQRGIVAHSAEKARLIEEVQRISDAVRKESWGVVMKLTIYHHQLDSAHGEIRILESLIKCREFEWVRFKCTLSIQDDLRNVREEISMLQKMLDSKKIVTAPKDVQ